MDAFDTLKQEFKKLVPLTQDELKWVDSFFIRQHYTRKTFLLQAGQVCRVIAFVANGLVRHFYIREGEEKTCDISLEHSFITDFKSFNEGKPSNMYFQVMEETEVVCIGQQQLNELYRACGKYETIGRMIAEKVALRNTEIAMSLASDKPGERYKKLLHRQPELFRRVPQKHIANMLGITPESLSRIRKRIHAHRKS